MENIRKRGPHQWQAQVRKKGCPTQTKTFSTRARAQRWALLIEAEMDQGQFVSRSEAETTTLGELCDRYLAEVSPSKRGAESEGHRLRMIMRHPLAQRFVAGIRGVDIARWRDERLCKVTSGTVKRDLVLIGHVFEVARKDWGVYIRNPVRDIRLPASGRSRDRRLQPGEEDRLIVACEQARNRWLLPAVQLALETVGIAVFSMQTNDDLTGGWFGTQFTPIATPTFGTVAVEVPFPLPAAVWFLIGGLGTLLGFRRK